MALAAVVLAVACSGGDDEQTAVTDAPAAAPTTVTTPPAPTTAAPPAGSESPTPGDPGADTAAFVDAVCSGTAVLSAGGTLPVELDEVSGLVASRRHPGVLWAIEDSLSPAQVYALTLDGAVAATILPAGVVNLDWEDLAVGPGPDGQPQVYVADIGDNLRFRDRIRLYVFPEPELTDGPLPADTITATVEGGPVNAEALLVDRAGGVWMMSRVDGGLATVYLLDGDTLTFRPLVEYRWALPGRVTAMDLSPDGTAVVVRSLEEVLVHPVTGDDIGAALASEPCRAPAPPEVQGESIAFLADGAGLVTVSEQAGSGQPVALWRITAD